MEQMDTSTRTRIIHRVSWVTIFVNLFLSVLKLAAGVFAHSSAMISDAIHSASDVFSTFTVMIGVKMAARQEDSDHQYGHERLECIASILLALLLGITGLGIGWSGIQSILNANTAPIAVPERAALIAAVLSIVCKEAMFWYTRSAATRVSSSALMADAWHHRSDALSSIGSFVGVAGARLGFPILDPIASIVICLFILKVSVEIFQTAVAQLTDRACPPYVEEEMRSVILKQDGVERLDLLRTRLFGSRYYVDVEIAADGNLTLYEAHGIAERIHHVIETEFPRVKHCMVHVNPMKKD